MDGGVDGGRVVWMGGAGCVDGGWMGWMEGGGGRRVGWMGGWREVGWRVGGKGAKEGGCWTRRSVRYGQVLGRSHGSIRFGVGSVSEKFSGNAHDLEATLTGETDRSFRARRD